MHRKTHISDLLNRFKYPKETRGRLNLSWNELSEAAVSHLESMMEENEKCCKCLHSPSSNRMVSWDVCDTWYHIECIELYHTFTHNTAVYICYLYIKVTFSGVLQYLCYNIGRFLHC